jgi:gliding motility-associated protein GldE
VPDVLSACRGWRTGDRTKKSGLETFSISDVVSCHDQLVLLYAAPQSAITVMVLLLLILLFLSFLLSGAEVAFFSLTFKDINVLKTKQHPSARKILKILDQPKNTLASMLIANTLVNIAIIILSNFLIDLWIDPTHNFFFSLLVKVVLLTSTLTLFAEVLPKVWATQNNLRFAYYTASIIDVVNELFKGFSARMIGFTAKAEKTLGGGKSGSFSLEELDQAIDLTTPHDATEQEKNMLKGVVKFGNITVRRIMRSRLDVHGIELAMDFPSMIAKMEELHYSRLPVYKNNLDNVVGIIHTKDLVAHLHEGEDFNWRQLMRAPYFVHENKLIEDLLREFQSKRIHFAVVVDEFGGTDGIVTMEDIMEEVIGDIRDEYDDEETANIKLDDHNYQFEGATMINDACRLMELPVDVFDPIRGNSETMAGLVLEMAGEIPVAGRELISGDFTFKVEELEKNRILKLRVTIQPIPNSAK